MAVTRERFEQGLTYDAFKAQMTRNQERFADRTAATYSSVHLHDLRWAHTSLRRVLVLCITASTWVVVTSFTISRWCAIYAASPWKRFLSRASHKDVGSGYEPMLSLASMEPR